jgi:hypothetical protein
MRQTLDVSTADVKIKRACIALLAFSFPLFCPDNLRAETTNHADRAKAYFARSEEICRGIETILGVPFKNKVAMDVQSSEDFREYVKKNLDRQFGKDGAKNCVKALVTLGALERPVDLNSTILDLMQDQALAHYDPEKKTFHLLMTNMPDVFLDPTLSHELCHAFQDQYHDLYAFIEKDVEKIRDNGDAAFAKQALVEGQATLVMTIWMIMQNGGTNQLGAAEFMAAAALRIENSMDVGAMVEMAEKQFGKTDSEGDAIMASVKNLKDTPRYFIEPMMASYTAGALMVEQVKSKGGRKAVEALYDKPPLSSEQVLHPDKIGGQDEPVDVRLPELKKLMPKGWRLLQQDVMGEMGIRVFLEIWQQRDAEDPDAAASAAEGWGGDRYYYFENEATGKHLLVWKTIWDTMEDAGEFSVAYRMSLGSRFPNSKKASKSDAASEYKYQIWEVQPGRYLKLATKGNEVTIVDTTHEKLMNIQWR